MRSSRELIPAKACPVLIKCSLSACKAFLDRPGCLNPAELVARFGEFCLLDALETGISISTAPLVVAENAEW